MFYWIKKKINISLGDLMRGTYDNGANMKGRSNGLQKKYFIKPRTFYVACAVHTLNLIDNNAAKAS